MFLKEIQKGSYEYNSVTTIEFEAEKSEEIGLKKIAVINEGFHKYCIKTYREFDIIVANPPYIRYQ